MSFDKKEYQREWVRNRKEKFMSQLGVCVFCGSNSQIQIHHIDPSKKESHKIWSWREDRIQAELKKCIPMCKNCHDRFHALLKMKPIEHGTLHAYQQYGCRCIECREARSTQYWNNERESRLCRSRSQEAIAHSSH